ncbi:F0F1 ATP synthase subunit delta [Clostridium tarantellae]|uniref:ATP synthase subunit delta n=1 Tax=Clostridium tarantellae TaxID=39493 RepID=A0A6I1MJF3_9CLOT|nr:F0F1 ATP synthase subunit delta [Clostridium tarantellae]MPQ42538.1 F0F1 ATP synthase subunit delta [Clostridium tarantellae]
MYEYLDRRYALALYQVAEEKGKVEEYLKDLREICDLIYNNKDFYEVIKHPQISTTRKKETFKSIFNGKIDDELISFLLILIEKDRILYLREKLNEMEKIHLEKNNTLVADVKSAIPLDKEQIDALINKLERIYNKKILLKEKVDKSIIGGLYVRVGDDVIDGTIKSKLDELRSLMLKRE